MKHRLYLLLLLTCCTIGLSAKPSGEAAKPAVSETPYITPHTYYFIASQGESYSRERVIYNSSRLAGAALRWGDRTVDENALWRFVDAGNDTYRLQNCGSRLFVAKPEVSKALNCITTTGRKKEAALFRIHSLKEEGCVWLEPEDGRALCAQQQYNFLVARENGAHETSARWQLTPATTQEQAQAAANARTARKGYKPIWNEEFDRDGLPDKNIWNFEKGFVRNHEDQWYQEGNAVQKDGCLVITGRKERRPNPDYEAGSREWGKQREYIEYTSSSLTTARKMDFLYGRIEVRAQIPCYSGSWPAIWMHGYPETAGEWPSSGEIDILEYYRDMTLANVVWASKERFVGNWETRHVPVTGYWMKRFEGWDTAFHTWRMDWDEEAIKLYLDDELITVCALSRTVNEGRWHRAENPFHTPMYLMLNLALGSRTAGTIDDSRMPMEYRVDYVRVWQQPRHIAGKR